MKSQLLSLPNLFTASRLALVPVLWVMALNNLSLYVGLGLIACFITDVLDGRLARRLHQVTEFGSKFDSLVDNLLIPSALAWLWFLQPGVYWDHPAVWVAAFALYFGSLVVGIIKFRRFANLHLLSKRYGSVVMYAFVSSALITGQYYGWLFVAAMSIFILSSAEGMVIQLTRSEVDEHMGSIVLLWLQREQSAKRPM